MSGDSYKPKRDLVGYGRSRPHPRWPSNARLALNFAINYEEGSESSIVNGDAHGEHYLLETIPLTPPPPGERLLTSESIYEYGSRVGIWRLFRLFADRGMKATVLAAGQAVELNPAPIAAMAEAGFEIASHHYRWIDYQNVPEAIEREHLRRSVEAIKRATGYRPVGFYHWSGVNTRRLVVEEGGFLYDSEAYNDELPYWVDVDGRSHLIIPYALDNNDFRYSHMSGWSTGEDFYNYNKATFDQLYEEGTHTPGMMTVGLHPRLSGRPGRAKALARFLDYVSAHEDVWICTRREIAEHWRSEFPADGSCPR